jgi:hypothetical protein
MLYSVSLYYLTRENELIPRSHGGMTRMSLLLR